MKRKSKQLTWGTGILWKEAEVERIKRSQQTKEIVQKIEQSILKQNKNWEKKKKSTEGANV